MDYLLLIYEDEKRVADGRPAEEVEEYQLFSSEFGHAIRESKGLEPTSSAATVRVRGGRRLVTDGPYAETREQLGGFCVVSARDMDEALALAAQIPGARHGCVEVRPLRPCGRNVHG